MEKCAWCRDGGMMEKYHDEEWGTVLHDDRRQFEYLLMEAMQCGLSWSLMLKKREIFRECFADFNFEKVAVFDDARVQEILQTPGMIRSDIKVRAIINNARRFLEVIAEWGSFDRYLWSFSDGYTMVYRSHQEGRWETRNELSDRIAADLKKRGFKYLGSVTVYSHLQACGMINDHEKSCRKYAKLCQTEKVKYV